MSWSADWSVPHSRIDEATLKNALQAACRAAGHRLDRLVAVDGDFTRAGIAIGDKVGCLEWHANTPTESSEQAWDREAISAMLDVDDEELDDDGYPRDEYLEPCSFLGLSAPTLASVEIVGEGRGAIVLDRHRNVARLRRVIASDELEDAFVAGTAGLSGIVRAQGRTFAFGGPALLYVDGVRVDTGIEEHLQLTAFHPIDARTAVAITDDGAVWRLVDGRATRLSEIVAPDGTAGYWDNPFSIAARQDELWIGNGSGMLYCIGGDGVRVMEGVGADRVVIGSDDRIWLLYGGSLLVGDGERFVAVDSPLELEALAAAEGGRVVAFSTRGPRPNARAAMLVIDSSGTRETPLTVHPTFFKEAVCTSGDLVWVTTYDSLVAIDPGGPPHTRMSLRSTRDDNADDEVWSAMVAIGNAVARQLGGWDVTRP
ncbi:MAG: hypothetical protein KIT84_10945 [Labilithrix sp.]|nr:hypothetical protein [Labilithrix sp.]MCW5811524.1 hypothetical protein [Labilithrix sp.]